MAVVREQNGLVQVFRNSVDSKTMSRMGGPGAGTVTSPRYGGVSIAMCDLSSTSAGATVAALSNPEGQDVIILSAGVRISAASSVAGVFDVGSAATSATTSNDNLLDGVASSAAVSGSRWVGSLTSTSATGLQGTNGRRQQVWRSSHYVTMTRVSGTLGSLRGQLVVEYIVP